MVTRRRFLALTASAGISALLTACQQPQQPGAGSAPTVAPKPTQAPSTPAPTAAAKAPTPQAQASPTMATAAKPDRTFTFAYLTLGWAGCEAIDELGLLEQAGWKLEWRRIDQISALANAFSAGQADLIDMSVIIAAQMFENGVGLRAFGTAVGTLGSIVVHKDSSIQAVEDLKGKKLAGVPGGTTSQDLNALVRKVYGFDLFQDTQFVQATAPPDVANLLINGNVEAALIWEPTTSRLTESGVARILTNQQELWKAAMGTQATQVHVVYLASPDLTSQYPQLLNDINSAQQRVAQLWTQTDAQVVKAFSAVTQLPPEVTTVALKRTQPLYGLSPEQKETIAQQLKFNRESGVLLKSDLWLDTEKVKATFFWP